MVADVDLSSRSADEAMVCEIAAMADLVMRPVLDVVGAVYWGTGGATGWAVGSTWQTVCEQLDYIGDGWCEPTDEDPYAERIMWTWEEIVFYRMRDGVDEIRVESDSDVGATWFYVRARDNRR
jgi:hypothetical protein